MLQVVLVARLMQINDGKIYIYTNSEKKYMHYQCNIIMA
jgi:hypothetical protein